MESIENPIEYYGKHIPKTLKSAGYTTRKLPVAVTENTGYNCPTCETPMQREEVNLFKCEFYSNKGRSVVIEKPIGVYRCTTHKDYCYVNLEALKQYSRMIHQLGEETAIKYPR